MKISKEGTEVVIRLTLKEAKHTGVDFASSEIYIEIDDPEKAHEDLSACIRKSKEASK